MQYSSQATDLLIQGLHSTA